MKKEIGIMSLAIMLTGCAALGAVGSLASGLFGNGGSGNSTNSGTLSGMTLNTQVGDNAAKKASVTADDITGSKVAGSDQENYTSGRDVIINKNSFWDIIGFGCVGFVLCLLIMWHLPQPKYVDKVKARLFSRRLRIKSKSQN